MMAPVLVLVLVLIRTLSIVECRISEKESDALFAPLIDR